MEYISKDDPQCDDLKKKIEETIQSQRKAIVEYVQYEMDKRREFIKDVKTGGYPLPEHGFSMDPEELQKFRDMVDADMH